MSDELFTIGKSSVCASCQRDRLMANAGDFRVISQAVTSVSQELAVLIDDVRAHQLFYVYLCGFCSNESL